MSSNLKVNTILPSTGSNIGIGTNGGELNVDGGCKVQVGTALTLGHSTGVQFSTQNLHSTGFEVNQINASGIVTATSFSASGASTFNGDVTFTGANKNVIFDKSDDALEFNDNAKIVMGDSGELELFHSPNGNSYFQSTAGSLFIRTSGSNEIALQPAGSSENSIRAIGNGAVELYHDNSKKIETTANGAKFSSLLEIKPSTYTNIEDNSAYGLNIKHVNEKPINIATGGDYIQIYDLTSSKLYVRCEHDAGVKLYNNNTARIETTSTGAKVTGNLELASAGQGIDFSATSDYSAVSGSQSELLDDYEEGSYNPTLTGSGGGSFAMNPHSLRYTKIGRVVHVSGRLYIYSSSGLSGAEVRMTLPYTNSPDISSQDARAYSYVSTYNAYTPNNDYQMAFSVLPGNSYGVFLWIVPNAVWQSVSPTSHMNQNAAYYGFDFTYTTAS